MAGPFYSQIDMWNGMCFLRNPLPSSQSFLAGFSCTQLISLAATSCRLGNQLGLLLPASMTDPSCLMQRSLNLTNYCDIGSGSPSSRCVTDCLRLQDIVKDTTTSPRSKNLKKPL